MLGIAKSSWNILPVLVAVAVAAGCTGEEAKPNYVVAEIYFETATVPDAGAGQFYNTTIQFGTAGGAAM
ncbi:MAG: hypothetical protein ACYSX0_21455, partial [Planctomycetota bacterium]